MNIPLRIKALGRVLAGATAAAVLLTGPAAAVTLSPESVKLPESTAMYPGSGPGTRAANDHCLLCHTADMVLNQPDLPKDTWFLEVNKMKNVFKAPIPEDQVALVADYLYAIKGKK